MSMTPTQEKRVKQENMEFLNRQLDAPIPGESLTAPPGSSPLEYPPQYETPEETLEALFDGLSKPQLRAQFIKAVEEGAPIEAVAKTNLFNGVMNGKWTPDTAMAAVEAHTAQLAWLAKKSGVKEFKILSPLVLEGEGVEEGIETEEPKEERLKGTLEEKELESMPAEENNNIQDELGF